jgi:hypothetical protein
MPSWGSSQLPIKAPTIRSIRHSKQGIGSRVFSIGQYDAFPDKVGLRLLELGKDG